MSAVPVHITSHFDPLAEAVGRYIEAKRVEDAATKARIAAEESILALRPAKEEGAETFEVGGYKVTLTGKLAYKCADARALAEACAASHMPTSWIPVKTKVELDATGCKWLRENEAELWARFVAPHVTVSPAKTSVSVKV